MTFLHNPEIQEIVQTYAIPNDSWQDWTPTVTQSVSVTATVDYARYAVLVNTAIVQVKLTITGSGTAGQIIAIGGQPSPIQHGNTNSLQSVIGSGIILDSGNVYYQGAVVSRGPTIWSFIVSGNGNLVGAAPNFGLAANDVISFQCTYERDS